MISYMISYQMKHLYLTVFSSVSSSEGKPAKKS